MPHPDCLCSYHQRGDHQGGHSRRLERAGVSFGVSRPLRYSGYWSERSFTEERREEVGMSRNVIVVAVVVIVIVVFLYLILR
jgi:cobalamin biosynthesis Mg chelatase CobN